MERRGEVVTPVLSCPQIHMRRNRLRCIPKTARKESRKMKIPCPRHPSKHQAVRVTRQAALMLTGLMLFPIPSIGRAQVAANNAEEITPGDPTPWVNIAGLRILELGPLQWITLAALTALSWFISVLVIKTAFRILFSIARHSKTPWNMDSFDRVRAPAAWRPRSLSSMAEHLHCSCPIMPMPWFPWSARSWSSFPSHGFLPAL